MRLPATATGSNQLGELLQKRMSMSDRRRYLKNSRVGVCWNDGMYEADLADGILIESVIGYTGRIDSRESDEKRTFVPCPTKYVAPSIIPGAGPFLYCDREPSPNRFGSRWLEGGYYGSIFPGTTPYAIIAASGRVY